MTRRLTYQTRRGQIETYFDRTAVAGLGAAHVRRAGGPHPRHACAPAATACATTLLGWLPADLRGPRLLDAGCGTGACAVEAARRGATWWRSTCRRRWCDSRATACQRPGRARGGGHIDFRSGDMLDPALGDFDHVVGDGLADPLRRRRRGAACSPAWSPRTVARSMLFTFAPRNPLLAAMHAVGRLFPRSDRAPAIEPVAESALRRSWPPSRAGLLDSRRARSASRAASTPRRRWSCG